jgi:ATP-dependent RNA helicase RhlE
VLAAFRKGAIRTLIATDIAARGIDVDGVSHVVNCDLPNVPETYVHRIGHTARMGGKGIAISLCDGEEMAFLRDILKLIRMTIPVSDRRIDQWRAKPAQRASTQPSVVAKQRHWHGSGPARKQNRHGHSNEAPRSIGSVAFLNGKGRTGRDRAPQAQRWTRHSKGT